ncbi:hypothetical protein A8B75_04555 [Sphingomonadales bacterium EhC05]|nr:hypothetical protein A8B75_04555 [Sphingomonadales bacterium EhC05]
MSYFLKPKFAIGSIFGLAVAGVLMAGIQSADAQLGATGATTTQSADRSCRDDGERFAGSGICKGQSVNYMNIDPNRLPPLMDGCSWEPNEASMPGGDWLLFLAASCNGITTQLEFSGGAKLASISIQRSALNGGAPGSEVAIVDHRGDRDPNGAVLYSARKGMKRKTDLENCIARTIPELGEYTYQVDLPDAQQAGAPQDGPQSSCDRFGRDDENNAYWRVLENHVVFFNLGQDAYLDFAPQSLTIIQPQS